jgi:predicted dinucleotide-binding enzyme
MAKAFNTLPAALLAQDPRREGGNRVIFLSGNDEGAMAEVTLVRQPGSAPVPLGTLETGGMLMQLGGALGGWAHRLGDVTGVAPGRPGGGRVRVGQA